MKIDKQITAWSIAGDEQPPAQEITERPAEVHGTTYKIRPPDNISSSALYLTINHIEQDGKKRPIEVFINSKHLEHYQWTVAMTRLISAIFRHTPDPGYMVEELKAVFDPAGGYYADRKFQPSLVAHIGKVIGQHLDKLQGKTEAPKITGGARCPKCGEDAVKRLDGCDTCTSCGHGKCG